MFGDESELAEALTNELKSAPFALWVVLARILEEILEHEEQSGFW